MPHMFESVFHCGIEFLVSYAIDLRGAPVEEGFQFLRYCGAAVRRWNLPGRDGGDADFLVCENRSAQKLFDG